MMLRYSASKVKTLKKLNINTLPGFSTKFVVNNTLVENKKFSRIKTSNYLISLLEKQKLKLMHGLKENIIKKYLLLSTSRKQLTLTNIVNLRLDSYLYNIGFCLTIIQSRQLIVHGHINVNMKLIKTPGYIVQVDDIISLTTSSPDLIQICRHNLYTRFNNYSVSNLSYNVLICSLTLKSKLLSSLYLHYTYVKFKETLIKQYYK